jgi:hypothetical protein
MCLPDGKLPYYLHTMACHGGEYMLFLGSLGKYMNEGLEHNHKITWKYWEFSPRGGAPGTTLSFSSLRVDTVTKLAHVLA